MLNIVKPTDEPRNPCNPSPCGSNAVCKERNGAGSCTCLPEYFGDPYTGCRPECVQNTDCVKTKACINNKCKDPCPGVCGVNAECQVINHAPTCLCINGYTGDPSSNCDLVRAGEFFFFIVLSLKIYSNLLYLEWTVTPQPTNPCQPTPCGPHSHCREIDSHAVCSCKVNYIGTPPNCRPECVISSDCTQDKACSNQKCVDPCPGTCGINARCQVVNHNAICSCTAGYTGDPFIKCTKQPSEY